MMRHRAFDQLHASLGFEIDDLHVVQGDADNRVVGKRATKLELLVQHGSLEVTRHWIAAGKHFYLDAADEWAGFEFIYVLSGNLRLESGERKIELNPGDHLHHQGLSQRAFFRVNTDVELLMVSSPPSYHLVREEIQGMMSLARSLEEKDEITEGHCNRLERLAIMTGERLGLSGQRLMDLSYAAYLHDIGKAKVPDTILNKNGPLTDVEQVEMRRHTTYGGDMLADQEFLANAARIVTAHHENYDGSGYPDGLADGDISIEARIIRVVDTYDAIVSARPYKKALAKEKAINELEKNAGTQFDPRVVRAFLQIVRDADDEKDNAHAE
ncbi:HD domain-containing protein [Candidatus Bipolaricaulota bacterium]|nr:HD domain-containing protein [Candidatus Bipolaricaulota bacterium]